MPSRPSKQGMFAVRPVRAVQVDKGLRVGRRVVREARAHAGSPRTFEKTRGSLLSTTGHLGEQWGLLGIEQDGGAPLCRKNNERRRQKEGNQTVVIVTVLQAG